MVPTTVSLWEAFRYWLKLGFISFGGPAGQIAIMHQELVVGIDQEIRRGDAPFANRRHFIHPA